MMPSNATPHPPKKKARYHAASDDITHNTLRRCLYQVWTQTFDEKKKQIMHPVLQRLLRHDDLAIWAYRNRNHGALDALCKITANTERLLNRKSIRSLVCHNALPLIMLNTIEAEHEHLLSMDIVQEKMLQGHLPLPYLNEHHFTTLVQHDCLCWRDLALLTAEQKHHLSAPHVQMLFVRQHITLSEFMALSELERQLLSIPTCAWAFCISKQTVKAFIAYFTLCAQQVGTPSKIRNESALLFLFARHQITTRIAGLIHKRHLPTLKNIVLGNKRARLSHNHIFRHIQALRSLRLFWFTCLFNKKTSTANNVFFIEDIVTTIASYQFKTSDIDIQKNVIDYCHAHAQWLRHNRI